MGDYTLFHVHVLLKPDTPTDIIKVIRAKIRQDEGSEDLAKGSPIADWGFFHGSSAYHSVKSFAEFEEMTEQHTTGEFEGYRINAMFQTKYGRGGDEFFEWIRPHVFVAKWNRGFMGWSLTEWCSSPRVYFAGVQT